MDATPTLLKPDMLLQGTVTDAVSDGLGLFRHEGQVVFVPGLIPGDVAQVRLQRKRRGVWNAQLDTLLQPSPDRVEPACTHFGLCGGCKWQQMSYPAQLAWKQKQATDALSRIGQVPLHTLRPIVGSAQQLEYRNKVEYTFSARRYLADAEFRAGVTFSPGCGFHVSGAFDKVLHLDKCHLSDAWVNRLRTRVYELALAHNIPFYHPKQQTGYLRNLMVRSASTGQRMVVLITAQDVPQYSELIFATLQREFPEIISLVHIENTKVNDSYNDLPFRIVAGQDHIVEQLGRYRFLVGPLSFFQTNTAQAEVLYQHVYNLLPSGTIPLLYDLYCGAGSIGIYVSDKAERIVGVEYVHQAVQDAEANCRLNNLSHLQFEAGQLQKLLDAAFVARNGRPDVVIVDPPRAGLEGGVAEVVPTLGAEYIIYVSCNPATQARDIKPWLDHYDVYAIQPVDMFPQTTHVENIVALRRKP